MSESKQMPVAASGASGSSTPDGTPGVSSPFTFESLLMQESGISAEQIARARRIAARMSVPTHLPEILLDLGQITRSEHDRILGLYRAGLDVAGILHEDGLLTGPPYEDYRACRQASPDTPDREILVDGGLVSEEQYLRALGEKHDVPYLEPEAVLVDEKLMSRVPFPFMLRHMVLPYQMADGALIVVMSDPLHAPVVQELQRLYNVPIKLRCAPRAVIGSLLTLIMNRSRGGDAVEGQPLKYREVREAKGKEKDEIGTEAVRIVDHLFLRALQMGASDIHLEPGAREVQVRARVDGVLRPLTVLPGAFASRVTARIKVLCGADLGERRLHQDGRIAARMGDREVDMMVSTYASMHGETVTVRLRSRERGLVPLDRLGFEPGILRIVQEVVLRPSPGLVLITGPSGSGKTTTLYSFVDALHRDSLKIITCEDPVEVVLDGVTQCSVNQKIGPTFVDSLRAMMRQDPDVMVVGEIRDKAIAELAIQAALTGRKVFATFPTEDAVSAVVQLLEMGIEPFLVSSALACVIGQRLVRRLCSACSRPGTVSRRDLRYLGLSTRDLSGVRVADPAGCDACGHLGHQGRIGIQEVLLPNDDFRDALLQRAPFKELRALAKRLPAFLSLEESGLLKMTEGLTTLSEVSDQVPRDPHARSLDTVKEIASRSVL